MKTKRHKWNPGIEQSCRNKGCRWVRMSRATVDGQTASGWLYRCPQLGTANWKKLPRVPRCEGKP